MTSVNLAHLGTPLMELGTWNIKISLAPWAAQKYMMKPSRNLQLGTLAKLVGNKKILKEYKEYITRERWATKMVGKGDREGEE